LLFRCAAACGVFLAAVLAPAAALASDLVHVQAGDLPIILTAPHGGRGDVPGCEARTPVGSRFVTSVDLNTDILALGIADGLRRLTGHEPYVVTAKFHRRYIDANRRPDEAYGSPACQAVYDAYHAAVRGFVDVARAKFGHAMLFDVHGQAAYPDSILRGTRHGAAVKSLLARAGASAVTGPDSVFGRFAAMGYRIAPSNDLPPDTRETPRYTGGYTVALYGAAHAQGIDAMQLEFGRNLRDHAVVAKTAADTASAIAAFYEHYLRDPERMR
jgi:N-formylglutamate amidohydrolase